MEPEATSPTPNSGMQDFLPEAVGLAGRHLPEVEGCEGQRLSPCQAPLVFLLCVKLWLCCCMSSVCGQPRSTDSSKLSFMPIVLQSSKQAFNRPQFWRWPTTPSMRASQPTRVIMKITPSVASCNTLKKLKHSFALELGHSCLCSGTLPRA